MATFLDDNFGVFLCFYLPVSNYFVFIPIFTIYFIASETHTEKKQKLHRINKVIKTKNKKTNKQTNSEFTHLHGNILTNIKIRYSNGNSIYYCT